MPKAALLFVCLGNICRSPLAEGAMRAAAERAGLDIEISRLKGRQLSQADFARFTHIFAMDHQNLRNIEAVKPPGSRARMMLLMDMVPGREGAAIADPYYDGEDQFEVTWEDVTAAAEAIVRDLF